MTKNTDATREERGEGQKKQRERSVDPFAQSIADVNTLRRRRGGIAKGECDARDETDGLSNDDNGGKESVKKNDGCSRVASSHLLSELGSFVTKD